MATPEPAREPTLADVLHAVALVASELASLRQVTLDNFAGVESRLQGLEVHLRALDRDIEGISRYIAGTGGDDA